MEVGSQDISSDKKANTKNWKFCGKIFMRIVGKWSLLTVMWSYRERKTVGNRSEEATGQPMRTLGTSNNIAYKSSVFI